MRTRDLVAVGALALLTAAAGAGLLAGLGTPVAVLNPAPVAVRAVSRTAWRTRPERRF